MQPITGNLLIAVPDLPDSNFYRSVVLVLEHNDEGAMGVVLNRPTDIPLNQLSSQNILERDECIHVGGPVQGPVMVLHNQYRHCESSVMEGVYMTISSDKLNHIFEESACQLKVFSGYSGWGPQQLENEIQRGGWLICPSEPEDIFGPSDRLWKQACERVGGEIMMPGQGDFLDHGNPNWN